MTEAPAFGLMAEFGDPERFLEAVRRVRSQGYRRMDAYSPNPIEGLTEAMELPRSPVALIVLIAALCGAVTGYFLQYYAAFNFPFNVGGRPLNSWVSFIPITFELTVLFACLAAIIIGIVMLNGLPHPYHPVFNVPRFSSASKDRFFLIVFSSDKKYNAVGTRRFLEALQPRSVSEVPS